MPPTSPIHVSNLYVAYGSKPVLKGLDMDVPAGSITALLGGNGAGKSTTLATLLGFVKPQSGQVRIAGVDPADAPDAARRKLAYLPENVALYEHLSASENADYLLALSGAKRETDGVRDAFRAAGLQEEAWSQRLGGFSKGMRQKVAIAVALLRETPVLLLDEPTSGLDPKATTDFNNLAQAVRDRGAAILMVTHDLLSAADIADRIAFLDDGRITHCEEASGPDRFNVRALHQRFASRTEAVPA